MHLIKNIVFDLGGVVFARDPRKFEREFIEFFSFIRNEPMPKFWEDYDRGTSHYDKVLDDLADYNSCDRALAEKNLIRSIHTQEQITATTQLIADLKVIGYKLFVLSNMSKEFIAYLREQPVYKLFDAEVVSCEEGVMKPEPEIYSRLTTRFGLCEEQTLFIDDRKVNITQAQMLGWHAFHFDANNPDRSCEQLRELLIKTN